MVRSPVHHILRAMACIALTRGCQKADTHGGHRVPQLPEACGVPTTPRDLRSRRRINVRLPTAGTIYTWEFERGAEKRDVAVDGPRTTSMPGAAQCERVPRSQGVHQRSPDNRSCLLSL